MPARAFVFVELDPAEGERFERTFAEVAEHFRTVPGMQANILLRDSANPGSYIVVSEWDSRESFLAWEEEPSHRELTKPLQEFWSGAGTARHLYEVAVTTDS
jgi:heme oxygenase (mycobilin-producing)